LNRVAGTPIMVVILAAVCFALSALLVYGVRALGRRRALLDEPNARSAHTRPTPRLGGCGVIGAFLAIAVLTLPTLHDGTLPVIIGVGGVSALGLLDDLRPVPARYRILVQAAAAGAVVWFRRDALSTGFLWSFQLPPWLLAPLAVLWIVWMTNLYNFMDGIDGLAAGQAIFASLGLAAFTAGESGSLYLLLVLLAASSAGFLVFNYPPATIFMGDAGSTAIGFFLACVPLLQSAHPVPVEAVWIAVGLFILDATATLARRVRNGERWYEAHRSHWYQRPLNHGVPHRTVTLWAYAGMAVLAIATAVFSRAGPGIRAATLAAPAFVFAVAVLTIRRLERSPSVYSARVPH
jgi:glycosyltransferase WbpL